MLKEISHIFELLWYTSQDAEVRIWLYQLWMQPASTVASKLKRERTWTYKLLRTMAHDWLVFQTEKKWVKHFRIKDPLVLFTHIERKIETLKQAQNHADSVSQRLLQFESQRYPHLPKISLFDWVDWIRSLYADMYETTIKNKYLVIKFFASNTFESQTSVHTTLQDYATDTFKKLTQKNVTIETFLGNWILIMEHITKTTNIENLSDLPAGNSSINIFVIWKTLYLIIFKDIPFWIKIDSEDVANTMHFLFEKLSLE